LGLPNACNRRAAGRARFTGTTIHFQHALEASCVIIHVTEIADAGTVMADGEEEQGTDFLEQPPCLFPGEVPCRKLWGKACPEKRLASVNVAQTGQDLLVQEEDFNGDGATEALFQKPGNVDFFIDWIATKTVEFHYFFTGAIEMERTEDSEIAIEEGGTAGKPEDETNVLVLGDGAPGRDDKFTRHAQMGHQAVAALEVKKEEFTPPPHVQKNLAREETFEGFYSVPRGDLFMSHLD
jgi:hypothetical protein